MQPKKEKPLIVIHKDEINVVYILRLLAKFTEANTLEEKEKQRANITNILNSNPQLRSKRELLDVHSTTFFHPFQKKASTFLTCRDCSKFCVSLI